MSEDDIMVVVGKWCKFPLADFRGLIWYPFPRGARAGYWRLYLDGVPDGFVELSDTCGKEVWGAVDLAQERSTAAKAVRKALAKAVKNGR